MSMERDLEFIYEMGALRYIDRTWKRFLNASFANNAEHHFRVAWIALILAKYEGVTNTDKILKMALVHDIAESRTGDVDYMSRQYVQRNDEMGITDILEDTAIQKEMKAIWEEYELRECIEAKIVKDADNLDVDFELREQAERGHGALGLSKKAMRDEVHARKLYTKSAKKMAKAIAGSNPHAWHANSPRNRINGGDWKK